MVKTSASRKTPRKKPLGKGKISTKPKVERRREWRFDLPLSGMIEGKIPKGKKFKEDITLDNISSGGAYFCLDSGVIVGSRLNLIINIPDELQEKKHLKLIVGGITVRLEEPDKKAKKQGVGIRFYKRFKVVSKEEKKAKK